jgi:hypothetical protein
MPRLRKTRTIGHEKSSIVRTSTTVPQTFHKYKTPSGLIVNSKIEAAIAEDLDQKGIKYEYEPKRIPYVVERYYVPDFILPNGIIIEVKGWFLSEDRRKMVLVKKQNPHLDIRFVFQKLDAKGQQSKVTNREWCAKNGFLCAESMIPEAWLK